MCIKVRGIGSNVHVINEWVIINLFILAIVNGKKVITYLRREAYIVDNLKVNVFLGVDILASEKILLNFKDRTVMIDYCNIKIDVTIISKFTRFRKLLFCQSRITIPAYGSVKIPVEVHESLLNDRDYVFEFKYNRVSFFISVVDANLFFIDVINDTESPLVIPARIRFGEI